MMFIIKTDDKIVESDCKGPTKNWLAKDLCEDELNQKWSWLSF